mgnify:CR=1 FL=1
MKDKCIHEIDAYFPRIGAVCNFSGCNKLIASWFGSKCLFGYDKKNCMGFVEDVDPRERQDDSI